jgi:hypothetical protein
MYAVDELENPSEAPPARKWFKRLVWSAVLTVVIAGSIILVRWKATVSHAQADLDVLIAELDNADPHWRIEDIEADRKEIPDPENTALVIGRIEAGLHANPRRFAPQEERPMDRANQTPPDVQIEPDIQAQLRADLKRHAPEVTLALSLATMKDGRFPLSITPDGVSTILNSQAAREAVQLLQQELHRRLRDGDVEGACVAARAMLVATRSVGDEPLLVSQLIRLACASVTVGDLERILAQGEPTEATLAALQDMLEEEQATPYLEIGLRGERGLEHSMIIALREGKVSLTALSGGGPSQNPNPLERLWEPMWSKSAARIAHPELLRRITEYIELAELPPQERSDQFRIKEQDLKNPDVPKLLRLLLPAVIKMAEADNRARALLRTAIAALAAERFRLAKNRWPKDLAELTPTYLKTVPLDPYDGSALRMRATQDGLVIYALGRDRKDNGGKPDRTINPDGSISTQLGGNKVFRLWNLGERRKPANNPEVGPPQPTQEELRLLGKPIPMMPGEAPKAP